MGEEGLWGGGVNKKDDLERKRNMRMSVELAFGEN